MGPEELVLISVDDHVIEPPGLFDGRLASRHADEAPRVVDDHGTERWVFQGRVLTAVGENALMGKPVSERRRDPATYAEMRTACFDVDERVRDMDAGGVLAALCFPTMPRFAGQVFLEAPDKELSLAALRAYNDWHLDAWCGAHPDRFIALGLVPLWDPARAAAEVHRLSAAGCHAVCFSENPASLGLPSVHSDHWDPFFAACQDEGTVVCIHIGSSSKVPITAADAPILVHLVLVQENAVMAAADWLLSRTFREFPGLVVSLSEGGIGWVAGFLERVERMHRWHGPWAGYPGDVDLVERFRRHFVGCFVDDPLGVQLRDRFGVGNIMWESDYPHPDSTWPRSPEHVWENLAGCDEEEMDAITHANAARVFRFLPFAARPRQLVTAGALRAHARDRELTTAAPYTGPDKTASLFARSTQPAAVGAGG
jgi:predicted TIM-barrel fold metal-dependent hydrolase